MTKRLLAAVSLLLLGAGALAAPAPGKEGWPRLRTAADGARVILYQPQVDAWPGYTQLSYHLAAEVWQPGANAAVSGARGGGGGRRR